MTVEGVSQNYRENIATLHQLQEVSKDRELNKQEDALFTALMWWLTLYQRRTYEHTTLRGSDLPQGIQ